MTITKTLTASFLLFSCVFLAACGGGRITPDEFQVMDRPPLVIPPESDLRPPRPGEPRAQTIDPGRVAFEALFPGKEYRPRKQLSALELTVLRRVGDSEPGIRSNVGQKKVQVVKKSLLLADLIAAENRSFQPDNITITRLYTESIRPTGNSGGSADKAGTDANPNPSPRDGK